MPVYCYKCKECDLEFEVRHAMSFEEQKCIGCESNDVFKVPSLSVTSKNHVGAPSAPGKIVDEYIRQTKKDITQQKKELKNRSL